MKALSFCTTCKNRLWQLEKTLPQNLEDNQHLKKFIEFVVIDFNSGDGLGDWIKKTFQYELREGYLKYYHTLQLPHWHMAIAKNTAHLCATGKIVTNLDCDNYTGNNGAKFILDYFKMYQSAIVLHQHTGDWLDGSCGRISVNKDIFSYLGGYDETFEPMGFEDLDFLVRLWRIGVKYVNVQNRKYNQAIINSKEDSLANCNSILSFHDMDMANQNTSLQKFISSNSSIRNNGVYGIKNEIYDHKQVIFKPDDCPGINFSQLAKQYKLVPLDDVSFVLETVYGIK